MACGKRLFLIIEANVTVHEKELPNRKTKQIILIAREVFDMKTMLIVDDNIQIISLLSSYFKRSFETFTATGVQEAIRFLHKETVDAIISDYYMKDGTGIDLLRLVRRDYGQIPFLLMSASDDKRIASAAQHLGGMFCEKTDRDLISKIKRMVSD